MCVCVCVCVRAGSVLKTHPAKTPCMGIAGLWHHGDHKYFAIDSPCLPGWDRVCPGDLTDVSVQHYSAGLLTWSGFVMASRSCMMLLTYTPIIVSKMDAMET